MPSGHPKDPVAHAAVLAANRAKKDKSRKRVYKLRKATASKSALQDAISKPNPRMAPVKGQTEQEASEAHQWMGKKMAELAESVKPENVIKNLEATIESQILIQSDMFRANELLRRRAEDAERRLAVVLDLVSKIGL